MISGRIRARGDFIGGVPGERGCAGSIVNRPFWRHDGTSDCDIADSEPSAKPNEPKKLLRAGALFSSERDRIVLARFPPCRSGPFVPCLPGECRNKMAIGLAMGRWSDVPRPNEAA